MAIRKSYEAFQCDTVKKTWLFWHDTVAINVENYTGPAARGTPGSQVPYCGLRVTCEVDPVLEYLAASCHHLAGNGITRLSLVPLKYKFYGFIYFA